MKLDYPIKFGRDLAAKVPWGKRADQVRAAKTFINETRAAEVTKVAADLQKISVDWSDAPAATDPAAAAPTANVDVKLESDPNANEALAGEPMNVKLTVT